MYVTEQSNLKGHDQVGRIEGSGLWSDSVWQGSQNANSDRYGYSHHDVFRYHIKRCPASLYQASWWANCYQHKPIYKFYLWCTSEKTLALS